MIEEPPADLGTTKYNYKTQGRKGGQARENLDLTPEKGKWTAFMVCNLIRMVNDASRYFKENHCDGQEANMKMEWNHHKELDL